jgi:probable HAF family extracellular repeat protein
MKRFVALLSALLLVSANQNAWGQVQYTVTDLGTLFSGTYSDAYGINNSGQVVGVSSTIRDSYGHAFLYSGGVMTDLLGESPLVISFAYGISNSGLIVGTNGSGGNGFGGQAFLYSGGSMQNLGYLPGATISDAYAINDSGQVAGSAWTGEYGTSIRAFLFSGGSMQDLGPFPGNGGGTSAGGINNSGQVVGWFYSNSSAHAFSYDGGVMTDLGTLGGLGSIATGINNSGQVVGAADTSSGVKDAFLFSNGTMQDLRTLAAPYNYSSGALGINNSGQIVGWSETISGSDDAFVYENGSMEDLNDLIPSNSGWTLTEPNAINDKGQIVGQGVYQGQDVAFLLTPVPEPTTLTLLGSALLGLGVVYLRRRGAKA